MLRSLSLASRGYVSIAQQRTLARGFAAEAAEPQVQNPPKPRGDSEFVKRRRTYRQSLHEYRVAFQEEFKQIEERDLEKDHEKITAERLARLNRKREKSEAKQVRAKKLAEDIRRVTGERRAYRKGEWERKQRALNARRAGDLQMLVESSHEWITEKTVQDHVGKVLDEFFIEVRDEEKGPKVVGW